MRARLPGVRTLIMVSVLVGLLLAPVAAHAAGGTVQGRLTDASTALAIEGFPVELWSYSHTAGWNLAGVTISGSDGAYSFVDVPPAYYDVEAVEIGYRWSWSPVVSISGTVTRTANVALVPMVPAAPAISGSVVDTITGSPVIGARVDVYYQVGPSTWDFWDRVSTNESGAYSVYGLPPINFRLGFSHAGYEGQFYSNATTIGAGANVAYDGSTPRTGIDARLVPLTQPASLAGIVKDGVTDVPLAGALVVARDPATGIRQAGALTDTSGAFTLPVPDRAMRIEVTSAGTQRLVAVLPDLGPGQYPFSVWLGVPNGAPSVAIGGVADGGVYSDFVIPRGWASPSTSVMAATMDGAAFPLGASYGDEGIHDFVLSGDNAGLGTTTAAIQFEIDMTPPEVSVGGVVDGHLYNIAVTPIVTVNEPGAIVDATLNGDAFTIGNTISADAYYALNVSAQDPAGNETSQTVRFVIDRTKPGVSIGGVADGGLYNTTVTPTVITDDPTATLWGTLNGSTYTLGTPVTTDGTYQFIGAASDPAGNTGWRVVYFRIDKTPAPLVVSGVFDGSTYATPVVPTASSTDASAVIAATLNGAPFSLGTTVSAEGLYTLVVTATDPANNVTTVTVDFEIGTKPSTLTMDLAPSAVQYPSSVTIVGTITVDPPYQLASYPITFRSLVGTSWVDVSGLTATASSAGTYSVTYAPSQNATLQAVFAGQGVVAPSESASVPVSVRAAVGTTAPATVRRNANFNIGVTLAPAHGSVSLSITRRQGASYVAYRTYTLNTSTGSATQRLNLPAGRYRAVATHSDADHIASTSATVDIRSR